MTLPHTEVEFYPEVKSQTGLSSLGFHVNVLLEQHKILFFQEFTNQTINLP